MTAEQAIERLYWKVWERRAVEAGCRFASERPDEYATYEAEVLQWAELGVEDGLGGAPWHD